MPNPIVEIIKRHQNKKMKKSKSIAGIVGPTLMVVPMSEWKLWNPPLYNTQIVPLVYFSGVLLFIGGLALIRMHHVWPLGWQTSLTLTAWLTLLLGAFRMFFPQQSIAQFNKNNSPLIVEIRLILLGAYLTFMAYFQKKNKISLIKADKPEILYFVTKNFLIGIK
jgi:hypothetical protein